MKIGIFVHSFTGNTYSVIERVSRQLAEKGHEVHIVRLAVAGGEDTSVSDLNKIQLETPVDVNPYEAVIFACPVRAFSQSPVMAKCLSMVDSLRGKRVACLVTQQFSKPWMGGNRTIKQIREQCTDKGGDVVASGIVNWKNKQREQLIKDTIHVISSAL